MLTFRAIRLQSLLRVFGILQCCALGSGAEYTIEDAEGDLLFLMDSSGSILPYEFTGLKEFVVDLLKPFTIGPKDVQISFVHVSDDPMVEFPFNKYTSNAAIQWALLNMKQKLGDTNTGKALTYAKDTMFTEKAGARADVPKVLVWLTDGVSSDDISQPIKLLKDLGVTVFIVSTGRGNYIELKAAASEPSESHLYYVDPDDLYVIMEELRNNIRDAVLSMLTRPLWLSSLVTRKESIQEVTFMDKQDIQWNTTLNHKKRASVLSSKFRAHIRMLCVTWKIKIDGSIVESTNTF